MRLIIAFLGGFLLIACSDPKPTEAPPLPLPVISLQEQVVPIEVEFVASIYGYVDIPVRARVDGYLEGIHFEEGEMVRKNQLLYSIDAQPFEASYARAQSEVAQAETARAKAESDLNRVKPLAEINAVSQAELDGAQANYDAALSGLEAARQNARMARIELGYTRISSPINGIIGKSLANLGEYVGREPNPVILNTISRTDSIQVEFFISENDYLALARYDLLRRQQGSRLVREFKLELILSDGSVFDYPGRVQFANREIDPNTGSLLIQSVFPNPDNLIKPGQFARVRLTLTPNQKSIIVPQRAVREFQGQYSVFIVDEQNKISERFISLSNTYRDYFVVQEGLADGERVVLEGLQRVREGVTIDPQATEFTSKVE